MTIPLRGFKTPQFPYEYYTHFYKNLFYKNHEAEIAPKLGFFKESCRGWATTMGTKLFTLNVK